VSFHNICISQVFPEEILYAYLRIFPERNAKSISKGNTLVKLPYIVILKEYFLRIYFLYFFLEILLDKHKVFLLEKYKKCIMYLQSFSSENTLDITNRYIL
jgi:hypothetical protein